MAPGKKRGRKSTGSHEINKRAKTSSGVLSPYAALALENAQFSRKCPELWIECVQCHKWRPSLQYFEEREVPDEWHCKMWITEDGKRGSCDVPSNTEESDIDHEPFPEGVIVWAKLGSYDEWPGMIESDPDVMLSTRETKKGRRIYNVTFFGLYPSRHWVFESNLRKYEKTDPAKFPKKLLRMAVEQGNKAFDTPYQARILEYSLAFLLTKKCKTKILKSHAEKGYQDAPEAGNENGPSADEHAENCYQEAHEAGDENGPLPNGHAENCNQDDAPLTGDENGPSAEGQASPNIFSSDPLEHDGSSTPTSSQAPSSNRTTPSSPLDNEGDSEEEDYGLSEEAKKYKDYLEKNRELIMEQMQARRTSSILEREEEEDCLSEEALAYKAYLEKKYFGEVDD